MFKARKIAVFSQYLQEVEAKNRRRGKERENKNIHHAYNMVSLEEDHVHTVGLILETHSLCGFLNRWRTHVHEEQ